MEKRLLLTILLAASLLKVSATDFTYFIVETASAGGNYTFTASGLTMDFSSDAGYVTVVQGDQSQKIALTDLTKMYFSNDPAGIEDIKTDNGSTIKAYTTAGVSLGEFDSVESLKASLKKGVYVVKTQKQTLKLAVK